MHILRLTKTLPPVPGGLERHALRLSEEQAKRHDVIVLAAQGDAPPTHPRLRFERIGVPTWTSSYATNAVLTAVGALPIIRRVNATQSIDLVHIHGDLVELMVLAPFLRAWRLPIVLTIHGSGISGLPLIARPAYQAAHHIIGVGTRIQEGLVRLGIPAERTSVISSGIDLGDLTHAASNSARRAAWQRKLNIAHWSHTLIFVGRLAPVKGITYLLDAMPDIVAELPNAGLLIVGDGPLRSDLEGAAASLPNVRFLGALGRQELGEVLGLGSLFILPSITIGRDAEGVPTSILEAMGIGLPIVTTDSGSSRDIVQEENGIVVPERNSEAIRSACLTLLRDPDRCARIANANRHFAATRDWTKIAKRVEAVYRTVIEE